MPYSALVPFALFLALLAAAALLALAASGHFPHRAMPLRTRGGAAILYGSLALAAVSLAVGFIAAARQVPWTALVIGGGAVLLAAPLILRALPDWFVDGKAAPLTFAGAAALIALAMVLVWAL
jgi:hypothetical protein